MSHNAKVKIFRNAGMLKTTVLSVPLYGRKQPDNVVFSRTHSRAPKSNRIIRSDSLKRSKDKIREICLLNEFHYFITLTFNDSIVDASNIRAVRKAFENWKRNMASRHNMCGIFVPEYHADEKRIHIHGLVSGDFNLVFSGHFDDSGRRIYNLENWKYGFTTAVMLDGEYTKVCNYIAKYITKDSERIFSHSYSTCGNIVIQPESIICDIDYSSFVAPEYRVGDSPLTVKYRTDLVDNEII